MQSMETYNGYVRSQLDAILLFEACRLGLIPRIRRRLSERERLQIGSGSVFVWDEREAGLRRWTDGKAWSASRVSGSFLTYREMDSSRKDIDSSSSSSSGAGRKRKNTEAHGKRGSSGATPDGAESDDAAGYKYKQNGLFKQSFSLTTTTKLKLHLISYYTREDITEGRLVQPSMDPRFKDLRIPLDMYPDTGATGGVLMSAVTNTPLQGYGYPVPSEAATSSAPGHYPPPTAPGATYPQEGPRPHYYHPPPSYPHDYYGQPNLPHYHPGQAPHHYQPPYLTPPQSHAPASAAVSSTSQNGHSKYYSVPPESSVGQQLPGSEARHHYSSEKLPSLQELGDRRDSRRHNVTGSGSTTPNAGFALPIPASLSGISALPLPMPKSMTRGLQLPLPANGSLAGGAATSLNSTSHGSSGASAMDLSRCVLPPPNPKNKQAGISSDVESSGSENSKKGSTPLPGSTSASEGTQIASHYSPVMASATTASTASTTKVDSTSPAVDSSTAKSAATSTSAHTPRSPSPRGSNSPHVETRPRLSISSSSSSSSSRKDNSNSSSAGSGSSQFVAEDRRALGMLDRVFI